MFKGHPKGLYVAFFANMGERFGYYTMNGIFALYLQAKFGYDAKTTSMITGAFLFGVYFLPLLGGFIADRFWGYTKTIRVGTLIMFAGYALLAFPMGGNAGLYLLIGALTTIALGTGFFKGNLQALVGRLYDTKQYSKLRDNAFNLFYMGINVGAFLAPSAAQAVNNWILKGAGYSYDAKIPALAHQYLNGTLANTSELSTLAAQQGAANIDLTLFCTQYIETLSKSYNYAFGVAAISMILSLLIFVAFRKHYQQADIAIAGNKVDSLIEVEELTPQQTKERFMALGLVFVVVIFFWMSFHQNVLTMTFFARDYTQSSVGPYTYIWFNLPALLSIITIVAGGYFLIAKGKAMRRLIGGVAAGVGTAGAVYFIAQHAAINPISPQLFQQFNPLYIVFLTPLVIGLFSMLEKRGISLSAPRKIGIGMLITAVAFSILIFGSMGLKSPHDLGGNVSSDLVSPYWLITTYFTLTIAELFLSPMGISFVSKVAPPKYKGMMMGGWFAATAIGNMLVGVVGLFWSFLPVWGVWAVLVTMCLLSATFMFSILKKLEKIS
jgi:POT family proton-dependent oligopeptide transporter